MTTLKIMALLGIINHKNDCRPSFLLSMLSLLENIDLALNIGSPNSPLLFLTITSKINTIQITLKDWLKYKQLRLIYAI